MSFLGEMKPLYIVANDKTESCCQKAPNYQHHSPHRNKCILLHGLQSNFILRADLPQVIAVHLLYVIPQVRVHHYFLLEDIGWWAGDRPGRTGVALRAWGLVDLKVS